METISYQIGLDLLSDKAEKELEKIASRIQKIDESAIIDFKYNGNYKELNSMLRAIEKKVPELPIDFRIGVLNAALIKDKINIDDIKKQIENKIGNPTESIKKIFEDIQDLSSKGISENFDEILKKAKEIKNYSKIVTDNPNIFSSIEEGKEFAHQYEIIKMSIESVLDAASDLGIAQEKILSYDNYIPINSIKNLEERLVEAETHAKNFEDYIAKISKELTIQKPVTLVDESTVELFNKIIDKLDEIVRHISIIPESLTQAFNNKPVNEWKNNAINSIEEVKDYLSHNVISTLLGWTEGDKLRLKIPEQLNERSFGYTKSGRIIGGYSYDSPRKTGLARHINKKAEEDNIRLYGYGHSHTNAKISMFSLPHFDDDKPNVINQSDFGKMIDRVENKQHDFSQEILKSFEEVLVFNSRDFYNDFKNYFQDKNTKQNTYQTLIEEAERQRKKANWSKYYDEYVSKYGSKISVGDKESIITKDRFFHHDKEDELAEEFQRQVVNLYKREVYPKILETVFKNGINGQQLKFEDYGRFYSNEEFAQLNPLGEQIDIIGSFIDTLNSLNTIVDRLTSIDLSAFDSLPIIADELSKLNLDIEPHQASDTTTYNDLNGKFGINLFPDKQNKQNDEPYSPTQTFDNEIQQNIVMLENYKNTIAEINRLELEPKTDEIEEKLQELNLLADYFASKITTIRSENGHEINRSMMQFGGTWNNNLSENYTSDQIKGFWDIAGERSGINIDDVESEFYGISEEIKNIEAKSEGLRKALTKDLTESSAYVSRLKADLLGIVETQEDLAAEPKESRFTERMIKDIEVFSKRSPEVLQFVERLKTYEDGVEFVKTDEWLQFLTTLPKAHTYLESIGYDFDKESVNVNNLGKSVTDVTSKINDKTDAFQEEGRIVSEVVEKEVNDISQIGNSLSNISQKAKEFSDEILNTLKNSLTGIESYPIISNMGIDLADNLVDRFRDELENNSHGIKDSLEKLLTKSIQDINFNKIVYDLLYEIQTKLNENTEQFPLRIFNFDIDAGELSVQIQNELNNKVFTIKLDGAIDNIAQTLNTSASNVENSFIQAIKWIREANEWQKVNDDSTHERFLFANSKTGDVSNPVVVGNEHSVHIDLMRQILEADPNKDFDINLHWHQDSDYAAPSMKDGDLGFFFNRAFDDNISKFIVGAQKEILEFDFSKVAQNRTGLEEIVETVADSIPDFVQRITDIYRKIWDEEYTELLSQVKINSEINYRSIKNHTDLMFSDEMPTSLISPLTGQVFDKVDIYGDIFSNAEKFYDPSDITEFITKFYQHLQHSLERPFTTVDDEDKLKDIINDSLKATKSKEFKKLYSQISDALLNRLKEDFLETRIDEFDDDQLFQQAGSNAFKKLIDENPVIRSIATYYTNDEFDAKYGGLRQQVRSNNNSQNINEPISPVLSENFFSDLQNLISQSGRYYVQIAGELFEDFFSDLQKEIGSGVNFINVFGELVEDFHEALQKEINTTNPYYIEIAGKLSDDFIKKLQDQINSSQSLNESDVLSNTESFEKIKQNLKETESLTEAEIATLSSLLEPLNKIKESIEEKNKLLTVEGEIAQSSVSSEIEWFNKLNEKINEIIITIGSKITMIRTERAEFEAAVQAELAALNQLINNPPINIKLSIDNKKLIQDIKNVLNKSGFNININPNVNGNNNGQNNSPTSPTPVTGQKPKGLDPNKKYDVDTTYRKTKDGNYAVSSKYKNKDESVTVGLNGDTLIKTVKVSREATEEEKKQSEFQKYKNELYKEERKLLLDNLKLQHEIDIAKETESKNLNKIKEKNEEIIQSNRQRIKDIQNERKSNYDLKDKELGREINDIYKSTKNAYDSELSGVRIDKQKVELQQHRNRLYDEEQKLLLDNLKLKHDIQVAEETESKDLNRIKEKNEEIIAVNKKRLNEISEEFRKNQKLIDKQLEDEINKIINNREKIYEAEISGIRKDKSNKKGKQPKKDNTTSKSKQRSVKDIFADQLEYEKQYINLIRKARKNNGLDEKDTIKLEETKQILANIASEFEKIDFNTEEAKTALADYNREIQNIENNIAKGMAAGNKKAGEKSAKSAADELEAQKKKLDNLEKKAKKVYENIDKYREGFRNNLKEVATEAIDLDNLDAVKSKIKELENSLDDKTLKENLEGTYTKLLNIYEKVQRQLATEPHMTSNIKAQYRALADEIDNLIKTGSVLPGTLDRITKSFIELNAQDAKTKGFLRSVADRTREMNVKFLGQFFSFYDIIRYGREIFGVIQELDTALVDLRKTTSMSTQELDEFYYSSNKIAKQMGVTTQEIIQQAANWSRLGYSTKEASEQMAALSSQFAAISPGMDVEKATDGLVSSMKAFHVEVESVESDLMDPINRLGNTMATTNEEIVDMLERSSAAMAAANNSIDETLALESAAVQITRNAETTGTAFRTISMRIRGKSLPPYMETYMLCA